MLHDIVRQTSLLPHALMPAGGTRPGEKVSASRIGSPPPARLDVLSLIGPGGAEIRHDRRNLVPQVRRWATSHDFTVHTPAGPVHRQWRQWHAEVVTTPTGETRTCRCGQDHGTGRDVALTRADNDQAGVIPPAEWADSWVRRWRLVLQQAARTMPAGRWATYEPAGYAPVDADQDKRLTRAGLGQWMAHTAGRPAQLKPVIAWISLRLAYQSAREQLPGALLGLRHDGPDHRQRAEDALAGARPPTVAHDPDTAGWVLRYGASRTAAAVAVDAHYLGSWLPTLAALDDGDPDGPDIAGFVAELQTLHRELQHVLGETSNEQWIGRCPTMLVGPDGEDTGRRCGAGLWHDPGLIGWRIQCHRCHTSWPETQWLTLAARIRAAWPIDTRRRYSRTDRAFAERATAMPRCHGCEKTMTVSWRPTRERGDREPMWQPTGLSCPTGCLIGGIRADALTAAA